MDMLDDIAVSEIAKFEADFRPYFKKHYAKLLETFGNGEKVTPENIKQLEKAATEFKKLFGSKK